MQHYLTVFLLFIGYGNCFGLHSPMNHIHEEIFDDNKPLKIININDDKHGMILQNSLKYYTVHTEKMFCFLSLPLCQILLDALGQHETMIRKVAYEISMSCRRMKTYGQQSVHAMTLVTALQLLQFVFKELWSLLNTKS